MSAERLPLGKECSKCGEWQLYEEFHRYVARRDGRVSVCKSCKKAYSHRYYEENLAEMRERKRRHREKNLAEIREYERRYYEENREEICERKRRHYEENREEMRARQLRYREENREYWREYGRRYYEENREKLQENQLRYREHNREKEREYNRYYRAEFPEKVRERERRRRARKLNAEGNFTAEEFTDLCEDYGSVCLCCGESERLTADHVIPLSKGGSNDISNIQPLCMPCNSRKGVKTTDYRPLFDKDIEELGETG